MRTTDNLRLAEQAGLIGPESQQDDLYPAIERFAGLVAAAEREACCLPDVTNAAEILGNDTPHVVVEKYRAAIRARGAT